MSAVILIVFCFGPAAFAETTWFGGTQRAMPVSLASPKEDGLRSAWVFNNHGDNLWDFNLGTDVSVWQETNADFFQSIGPRFGVATRFQFNSGSFDMWATDVRGGGVYGLRLDDFAGELFFYHESSHLGDEILERGDRQRIDYNVNGLRLTASWEVPESMLPCSWFAGHDDTAHSPGQGSTGKSSNTANVFSGAPAFRLYGGFMVQPWAKPDSLESFGFNAGIEMTQLPPWRRGYVAVEIETWEWRSWSPDAALQAGLFIGPKGRGKLLQDSRTFVELRTGQVRLGQFYNETEQYFGFGLGTNW